MRTLKAGRALLAGIATIALCGCATIVSDSQYPVNFHSAPEGASFTVTNRAGQTIHTGTTPATVSLKSGAGYFKGEAYTVVFHKDGFADQKVELNADLDGWYWGNIIFGGLIGMLAVDPATGAMYRLPESARATLPPVAAAAGETSALQIVALDQVPEPIRKQLVRIN
jgi:hypothetical protein